MLPPNAANNNNKRKQRGGSGFGSAGKRTPADKAAAVKAARALVASFPASSILIYTDGACRPNPGPAGAGALLEFPVGMRPSPPAATVTGTLTSRRVAAITKGQEKVPPLTSGVNWCNTCDDSVLNCPGHYGAQLLMPPLSVNAADTTSSSLALKEGGSSGGEKKEQDKEKVLTRMDVRLQEPITWGTNQVGELVAVALAFEYVLSQAGAIAKAPRRCHSVELMTDSAYTYGLLVQGWKASINHAEVERARTALRECKRLLSVHGVSVNLHWVAGHVGLVGNEEADRLANCATDVSVTRLTQAQRDEVTLRLQKRKGKRQKKKK